MPEHENTRGLQPPQGPIWLTYVELADRLHVSPQAARQKALRGRWRRQMGNDGKARVLLDPQQLEALILTSKVNEQQHEHPPEHVSEQVPTRANHPAHGQAHGTGTEQALVKLLEGQIDYLKTLLDTERSRADRLQGDLMDLARTHAATLERFATERDQRKPWWRWRT